MVANNSSGFLECSRFLVLCLNHHAVMTMPEELEHIAIAEDLHLLAYFFIDVLVGRIP